MKDSTDWRKTGDKFVALQKEWKTIGPIDKKYSDAVWKRFLEACDYFFEQRKKATSGTRKSEHANLKAKMEVIEALKAIGDSEKREDAIKKVRELMSQWQQIGHVPFKEKDKIYETYKAVVDELYDRLDIKENRAQLANFASSIEEIGNDENRLYRERERLTRIYEQNATNSRLMKIIWAFSTLSLKAVTLSCMTLNERCSALRTNLSRFRKRLRSLTASFDY